MRAAPASLALQPNPRLPLQTSSTSSRTAVTLLSVLALFVEAAAPSRLAARELSRGEYDSCQATTEPAFRAAVEKITLDAFDKGLAGFDYRAAVADGWRTGGLDDIVDKRVDLAVAEVKSETSTGDTLKSIVNADTAKGLAEKVAERVYRSEAMKAAIETLAGSVGRDVGKRIELASQDASEPALACLQAFLGPRYGSAIARAVMSDAGRQLGVDVAKGSADLDAGSVIKNSSEGIAGAAILLVRRQLANMAARVGQRLVGSVLSRLVSVAAGGVGLVLIAKDLWDLSGGVFPIIATEMKSRDTKDKVQEELAKSIAEQVSEHVREIGAKSADRVVDIWQEFRRAHVKVIELAERSEPFKAYVDKLSPAELPRLDEVTGIILASEGEPGILKRLVDGTLADAVSKLPPPGMQIARETRSIEAALGWAALAGPQLARIAELGLYTRASPQDFSKASLDKTLSLGERLTILRVAGLKREVRDVLFDLEPADLKALARGLTEAELDTLARYLTGLQKEPREAVLKAVAARPARMAVIADQHVRDAILSSRDQAAAVNIMLREDPMLDPARFISDARAAWDGRIAPILVYEKHPASAYVGGGLGLLVALMLRRLFSPRRRRATPTAAGGNAKT